MAQNTGTVEVEHGGETHEVPWEFNRSELSAWYGSVPDEIRVDRIFVYDGVLRAEMCVEDGEWVEVGYFTDEDFNPGVDTGWVAQRLDNTAETDVSEGPGETLWSRADDSNSVVCAECGKTNEQGHHEDCPATQ